AASPTVAVGQIVYPAAESEEAAVHGLLAVYRPDSGPIEAGASQGGLFQLDMTGSEGKTRRLTLTDLDAWHWENLTLPTGVRTAPFLYSARTKGPITATVRFGAEGLEGKLTAGPFQEVSDAILRMPNGRNLAVHLRPDGTFGTGSQDILPT